MTHEVDDLEPIETFRPLPKFREIMIEDMKCAAAGAISDEMIEDMLIDVIRCEIKHLSYIYIQGIFRSEVLEKRTKVVSLQVEYPKTLWQHFKQNVNKKLGTHFEVEMQVIDDTRKVSFKRSAIYPHMPSLKAEYGHGRYVIKEAIYEE